MFVNKIMESAHWLSAGDLKSISLLVPAWRRAEVLVTRTIEYVQIVQDMNYSLENPIQLEGNLLNDLNLMIPFIESKK
jgi:hypothetical protein